MTVRVWNSQESQFEEPSEDIGTWTLLAADSWLVVDGRVRAFERHRARFADAAEQVGVGALVTAEFWASVVEKIPKTGKWFPRVDVLESATGGSRILAFRLRPAPPRTRELRVLIPPYSDPRSTPRRKGPDIALLERLRAQAREEYDCDEVLLLSEDGYVIEGATTSLLWWDGDTLCAPDPALGALPGVTSSLILDEARARLIPVAYQTIRPGDLSGHEIWLVNALHGLRQVVEFVDWRNGHSSELPGGGVQTVRSYAGKQAHEQQERFVSWRCWLEDHSGPVEV
jgi:branched-subunit amino acid aminotransferase/4-amino-4-deoxychorismate lyase